MSGQRIQANLLSPSSIFDVFEGPLPRHFPIDDKHSCHIWYLTYYDLDLGGTTTSTHGWRTFFSGENNIEGNMQGLLCSGILKSGYGFAIFFMVLHWPYNQRNHYIHTNYWLSILKHVFVSKKSCLGYFSPFTQKRKYNKKLNNPILFLLHECFLDRACKSHFITRLANT